MWLVIWDSTDRVLYQVTVEARADALVAATPGTRKQFSTRDDIRNGDFLTIDDVYSSDQATRLVTAESLAVKAQEIYRSANPQLRWAHEDAITSIRRFLHHQAGEIVRLLASTDLTIPQKQTALDTYAQVTPELLAQRHDLMVRSPVLRNRWLAASIESGQNAYSDVFGDNGVLRVIDGSFNLTRIGATTIKLPYGEMDGSGITYEFNPEDMAAAVANPVNQTPDGTPIDNSPDQGR